MTATTSGERVLIVEDEPTTRLGLTELVRTWGFTTDSAADGEEALQKITSFRPSIIISDLVMPRMGGLELLRALKDEGDATDHRHPDRAGHRGDRGRGDQGRRLRLPDQADRAAAPEDPARQDRRAPGHAARGEGAAPAAARARQLRQDDRQQPADAEGLPDRSSRRRRRRRRCSSGASRAPARSWSRRRFIS